MYFATPNRLYFPRVSIDPTKPEKRVSGKWTVFTTWFLLVCFAWFSGGFSDFFYIAKNFLQGDLQAARNHDSISNMVPTIIATVAILFVVIFVLILAHMRGSSQKTEENIFETISPKRQFAVIMTTLTAEELIRQIFLGWLTKVPGLNGTIAFYTLFLISNCLWTMLHFRQVEKKSLLLSQFLGGVFFTIVYLPYGFFGALMAHVICDMLLFSEDRKEVFRMGRLVLVLYHLMTAGVSSYVFFVDYDRSLTDLKCLALGQYATLTDWSFEDYRWAMMLVTSITLLLLEITLYDREMGWFERNWLTGMLRLTLFLSLSFLIIQGLRLIPLDNMMLNVVIITILAAFWEKTASGTGVARLFWESLILTPLIMISCQALGVKGGAVLIFLFLQYLLPDRVIRSFNKEKLYWLFSNALLALLQSRKLKFIHRDLVIVWSWWANKYALPTCYKVLEVDTKK
jgi:hypothetical protein